MCVYVFVQYDTRTNWRTGEERADRAGVKSEGGCTYGNDAVFDFPSTPCENIHAADGVIWSRYCVWRYVSDFDLYIYIYTHTYVYIHMSIHICIHMYTCVYIYTQARTHTNKYSCICGQITWAYACLYGEYIHTYIFMSTLAPLLDDTHTHICIYSYTHKHACFWICIHRKWAYMHVTQTNSGGGARRVAEVQEEESSRATGATTISRQLATW